MTIAAKCRSCGRRYDVRDEFAGRSVPCKQCGAMFRVPKPAIDYFEPDDGPARKRLKDVEDDYDNYRPRKPATAATRSSSGAPTGLLVGAGIVGGVLLLVSVGLLLYYFLGKGKNAGGDNTDSIAVPSFPDLPAPKLHPASGAKIHFVDLGTVADNGDQPGMRMKMRVYLPAGNHDSKSLGCILVAPAGTPLLHGNDMDNDDYHAETLPYVQAGYAVVFYSIDGSVRDSKNDTQVAAGYKKFKAARAGVINGRNALEFVLAKLPQVDPDRIYSAGHSSAGVLSLLLAANEPRVKACIAYAPATDVETRLRDVMNDLPSQRLFPGLKEFLKTSSPMTHIDKYNCPLFLFHARDDTNEPFTTTERFANRLREAGKNVTFSTSNRGNHYQSMVRYGIPRAILWLKALPGERGKSFPATQPSIPPPRQPPVARFPTRQPPTSTNGPIVTFDVSSFQGRGQPQTAARKALGRFSLIDAASIRYDAAAKQLSFRLRRRSVSTRIFKVLLQREGFTVGAVRVSYR